VKTDEDNMAHISAFRVAVVDRLDVMCLLVCYHDEATLSGTILPSVFFFLDNITKFWINSM